LENSSGARNAGTFITNGLNLATDVNIPAATPKYKPSSFNPALEAQVAKGMKIAHGVVGVVGKSLGVLSAVEHGSQAIMHLIMVIYGKELDTRH